MIELELLVVHWQLESYDVYIGRPSIWGNPFSHLPNTMAMYKVKTRDEAIEKYEEWIQTQPHLLARLPELEGKVLGCWCRPKFRCHGEILVRLANSRRP